MALEILSGDWIPVNMPNAIKKVCENARVVSLGGATEGSIWSIYYPVDYVDPEWKSIPYGKPLANQTYYVLNYEGRECPVGVSGELYIGGKGVAQGYFKDQEKTNKAFIVHPKYGRIYRTGDYGVLLKTGIYTADLKVTKGNGTKKVYMIKQGDDAKPNGIEDYVKALPFFTDFDPNAEPTGAISIVLDESTSETTTTEEFLDEYSSYFGGYARIYVTLDNDGKLSIADWYIYGYGTMNNHN